MERMEEDMIEIDLRDYLRIIKKRGWIIAAITLIAIITSAVISFGFLTPIYSTGATLMVIRQGGQEQAADVEYSDLMANRQLVKSFGEIVKSRTVAQRVVKNLSLDMTPEALLNQVEVNYRQQTEIVQISVENSDPKLARDIANSFAYGVIQRVQEVMGVDVLRIIDLAVVPQAPIKPRPQLNIAIAALLGLMVSVGIVFLMEYFDNTIKTTNDVERYLELPVIGMIPKFEMAEEKEDKSENKAANQSKQNVAL